eukprot:2650666-Amphidinium_carterae.1
MAGYCRGSPSGDSNLGEPPTEVHSARKCESEAVDVGWYPLYRQFQRRAEVIRHSSCQQFSWRGTLLLLPVANVAFETMALQLSFGVSAIEDLRTLKEKLVQLTKIQQKRLLKVFEDDGKPDKEVDVISNQISDLIRHCERCMVNVMLSALLPPEGAQILKTSLREPL